MARRPRRHRLELGQRAALFQEGRARHGFRRPVARPRRPAFRCAASFPDLWPEHAKSVAEAFKQAGWEYIVDQNAEWKDGYFPITISNAYERRVSAAIGYLDPGTRMRDNLTIFTEAQVASLLFDGNRCVGVKALVAGREQEFRGNEIILSCGAIHSPAHLMRAGIGPVGHLRDLGIDVRVREAGRRPAAAVIIREVAAVGGVPETARANHSRLHAPAHLCLPALFVQPARYSARRHDDRGDQQNLLARGGRTDRLVSIITACIRPTPIPVKVKLRTANWLELTNLRSISTCCQTSATWNRG